MSYLAQRRVNLNENKQGINGERIRNNLGKYLKYNMPPKSTLENLYLNENKTYRIIGEIFGVNPNTARRWILKYDIPLRTKQRKNQFPNIRKIILDNPEKYANKTYQQVWVELNPDRAKEHRQRSNKKDKERYHTDLEYQKRIRKDRREYSKKRYNGLKIAVIQKLGGKCVYCGCDVLEALEINHVNGGGSKELSIGKKRISHMNLYLGILKRQRKDVELVCRVCNSVHWLKLKGITGYAISWKKVRKNE